MCWIVNMISLIDLCINLCVIRSLLLIKGQVLWVFVSTSTLALLAALAQDGVTKSRGERGGILAKSSRKKMTAVETMAHNFAWILLSERVILDDFGWFMMVYADFGWLLMIYLSTIAMFQFASRSITLSWVNFSPTAGMFFGPWEWMKNKSDTVTVEAKWAWIHIGMKPGIVAGSNRIYIYVYITNYILFGFVWI